MDETTWIAIGTVAVSLVGVCLTFLGTDRRSEKLKMLREAIDLHKALEPAEGVAKLELHTKVQSNLEAFIKSIGRQIGDVWWRGPFGMLGLLTEILALINLGVLLFVKGEDGGYSRGLIGVSISYAVIGAGLLGYALHLDKKASGATLAPR